MVESKPDDINVILHNRVSQINKVIYIPVPFTKQLKEQAFVTCVYLLYHPQIQREHGLVPSGRRAHGLHPHHTLNFCFEMLS